LTEEDRWYQLMAAFLPNLVIGAQADMIFWFLILPRAVDRIDMLWGYLLHPSSFDEDRFEDLMEMTMDGIAAIQGALSSRFAPRGPYSWQEAMLVQLNRWLVRRYRARLPS
jgi:hypothetical protein